MTLLNKFTIPVLATTTLISPPSQSSLYDNFSSNTLNPAKWAITQDPEGQSLTELYDVQNGAFYAQNITNPDRRTVLSMTGHTFQPGETLDYDVNYVSGDGNRAIVIFVDNGPLDRASRDFGNSPNPHSGGSIGYNGGDFATGNIIGRYHVHLGFRNDGLDIQILRPDLSSYEESLPIGSWIYGGSSHSTSPPFHIGFETWSNGSIRAEYDNFYINEIPSSSTLQLGLGLAVLGSKKRKRNN